VISSFRVVAFLELVQNPKKVELTNNHSVNRQEFLVWLIEITQVLLEQEAHDDNENDDLEAKHNSGAGGVKGTLVAFECISGFPVPLLTVRAHYTFVARRTVLVASRSLRQTVWLVLPA